MGYIKTKQARLRTRTPAPAAEPPSAPSDSEEEDASAAYDSLVLQLASSRRKRTKIEHPDLSGPSHAHAGLTAPASGIPDETADLQKVEDSEPLGPGQSSARHLDRQAL